MNLSGEFVLHSPCHTYGTRLGEAGAGAFTGIRLMGRSGGTVFQRYIHPTNQVSERGVE